MPLDLIIDADGWPDSVQVVVNRNHVSDDGNTTTTGSASFTWSRASLGQVAQFPTLPHTKDGLDFYAEKATYLAVQYALGKMPGWLTSFGPQDDTTDSFTTTTVDPDHPDSPPVVTTFGQYMTLTMLCTRIAPGRSVGAGSSNGGPGTGCFLGLNNAFSSGADGLTSIQGAGFGVALLQAGQVATPGALASGAVYRLTLPPDVEYLENWSVLINGAEAQIASDVFLGSLANLLVLQRPHLGEAPVLTVFPRDPFTYDVLTALPGDVISSSALNYRTDTMVDSVAFVNGVAISLPDPFSHGSILYPRDDDGVSIELSF